MKFIFRVGLPSILSLLFLFSSLAFASSSKPLSYYLPDEQYDPAIPTPESILGYQVGDWHVRHDQIVTYFEALAKASDRVTLKTIGHSHEQRKLLQVLITTKQNHNNIDAIQSAHISRLNASKKPNHENFPLIVNLNYSVHGDEPSGSNASLLVGYYLAASNNPEVLNYLDNMVILLDPSLNPDGLSRFAQWANQHKGMNLNADPDHREHVQPWLRGRVNHYWFDLNRDWLLLQHPESRARITEYHQWRPNVLTDHHEMGTHSTFFFQPGIPSRKNPLTPEKNVELTKALAEFHAKAFDQQNKLYFTEESYDDFYAGKGSTYPDLHGTIGILYEQASSRGHVQESINGLVEFPMTIKHQVMVTWSTLEGSLANKNALMDYQWEFAQSYKKQIKDIDHVGYVLTEEKDKTRFNTLLSLLKAHDINVYELTKNTRIKGTEFNKSDSVFVPLNQPQIRLIESVFSEQTSFNDNTFYDVSSWNLAMAFNIEYAKVDSLRDVRFNSRAWQETKPTQQPQLNKEAYSYAVDWADHKTPALIYDLLKQGIVIRSALKPFSSVVNGQKKTFESGTMLIHSGLQKENWFNKFEQTVAQHNIAVTEITTGLTATGIDLGSRNMLPVNLPNILLVGGIGTNPYEVGETWYFLDRHVGVSPTIIEKNKLGKTDLAKYTHIILTDGSYGKKNEKLVAQLKDWLESGGVIWSQKDAAIWLAQNEILKTSVVDQKTMKANFDAEGLTFADRESLAGRQRIAGAFFETELDLSHPLSFGFSRAKLPMFKNSIALLNTPEKPFLQFAKYSENPLISGYADDINVKEIAGKSAVIANTYGRGVVIGMTDNPNFRGFTYGTSRLIFNALFLAHGI